MGWLFQETSNSLAISYAYVCHVLYPESFISLMYKSKKPCLHGFSQSIPSLHYQKQHKKQTNPHIDMLSIRILTQNVAGFRKHDESIDKWFQNWKSNQYVPKLDVICLQETHITSSAQAKKMEHWWLRVWGLTQSPQTLSFWTITDSPKGGVAILINPFCEHRFELISLDPFGRYLQIQAQHLTLVNVYAPSNSAILRNIFF